MINDMVVSHGRRMMQGSIQPNRTGNVENPILKSVFRKYISGMGNRKREHLKSRSQKDYI